MELEVYLYGSRYSICANCGCLYLKKKGHNPGLCETVRSMRIRQRRKASEEPLFSPGSPEARQSIRVTPSSG